MNVYDSEYRRQSCRERIDAMRDEYRRVQPADDSRRRNRIVVQIRSVVQRVRRQVPQRVPVYRP